LTRAQALCGFDGVQPDTSSANAPANRSVRWHRLQSRGRNTSSVQAPKRATACVSRTQACADIATGRSYVSATTGLNPVYYRRSASHAYWVVADFRARSVALLAAPIPITARRSQGPWR
jgi:hypothetical protein